MASKRPVLDGKDIRFMVIWAITVALAVLPLVWLNQKEPTLINSGLTLEVR